MSVVIDVWYRHVEDSVSSSAPRNDPDKDSSSGGQAEVTATGIVSSNATATSAACLSADDDSNALTSSSIPRKHKTDKKLHRVTAPSDSPSGTTDGHVSVAPLHPFRKPTNPYSIYLSIKMKVSYVGMLIIVFVLSSDCVRIVFGSLYAG